MMFGEDEYWFCPLCSGDLVATLHGERDGREHVVLDPCGCEILGPREGFE